MLQDNSRRKITSLCSAWQNSFISIRTEDFVCTIKTPQGITHSLNVSQMITGVVRLHCDCQHMQCRVPTLCFQSQRCSGIAPCNMGRPCQRETFQTLCFWFWILLGVFVVATTSKCFVLLLKSLQTPNLGTWSHLMSWLIILVSFLYFFFNSYSHSMKKHLLWARTKLCICGTSPEGLTPRLCSSTAMLA